MTRLLVLGLLVVVAFWALGRFLRVLVASTGGPQRAPRAGAGPRTVPTKGADLVRDRVCNTYLPKERALTAPDASGETLYFCSERCRDAWLASR